ncbi:MAG TPA: trimethylamine methyltransferase family protein [Terriglobales bacterium]|nr:trimethylamine methyltransferase family protein [Terriglobales bacterium]
MRPKIELLDDAFIERILSEAFELLVRPGVRVQAPEALELLASSGARVERALEGGVAHIPEAMARQALQTVPHEFFLYDRAGKPAVHYGGDDVHFDPGSSCVYLLDPETREHRPAQAADLVRLLQVAEMLPQYAAQSTAMVCSDAAAEIGDLYRLFLVLWYSNKPVVTGGFSAAGGRRMLELLAIEGGGQQQLRLRPRAVFDVCPSPPLTWTEFAGQSLIDLARAGVPAEIISMPLAGAAAPVTLAGAVVQHAAECLSGITIHQLAAAGAPVVWGGAPAIFDMRTGNTPMGAVETAMIDIAYAQVGKHLGLPTHTYLVGGDAKTVDAQAGMEAGMAAVLGALAGINMISGAGMLNFLAAMSVEKVVIDAEAIGYAQRLVAGIEARTPTLATQMFGALGHDGDFLKLKETRQLFRSEQYLPSAVIDRESLRGWQEAGSLDAFERARVRVNELVRTYRRPEIPAAAERELGDFVEAEARRAGMERLPGIEERVEAGAV